MLELPKKRKRDAADVSDEESATKRPRQAGEVRILSANTCGFNADKWEKLKAMAITEDIDMVTIQEGCGLAKAKGIVGDDWEVIATTENHPAGHLRYEGASVAPLSSRGATYLTIVKKSDDIKVTKEVFRASDSAAVQEYMDSSKTQSTSRSRNTVSKVKPERLRELGARPPQKVKLKFKGRQAVSVYNNHAPEGGGSANGYSGMDAICGHEILKRVIENDNAPHHVLVGDHNANTFSMREHYPANKFDLLSVPSDQWSHAAVSKGLTSTEIDLGSAGQDFKNKGAQGCSDHAAFAFSVFIPEEK